MLHPDESVRGKGICLVLVFAGDNELSTELRDARLKVQELEEQLDGYEVS